MFRCSALGGQSLRLALAFLRGSWRSFARAATAVRGRAWRSSSLGLALLLAGASAAHAQSNAVKTPMDRASSGSAGASTNTVAYAGIGRAATPAEIRAWDIDVRPDFKGLPKGSGTVAKGQDVWEAKCASCHGVFGESNEVFPPLVGGTTKRDQETGRVAALSTNSEAQRTTLMKLSNISTLWDYINRAMPWNAPKTLTTEEVYAVTAYILHLGDVLPVDFTLSDKNIADVQKKLPNRNGKTREHGMWRVAAKPDVQGDACMTNCNVSGQVASALPDFARNAHGNLMAQQRVVGSTRGADTTQPKPASLNADAVRVAALATVSDTPAGVASSSASSGASAANAKAGESFAAVRKLAQDNACMGCHGVDQRLVGPSLKEVAAKYGTDAKAEQSLAAKIKAGGAGVWGATPMPPSPQLKDNELTLLAQWILKGAP